MKQRVADPERKTDARSSTANVMAIALNAVSNVSSVDVTEETVMSVLRTGDGPGGMVRALFGHCSLETLERLSAEAGMSSAALRSSYRRAKALHAAINGELDVETES